MFGSGYSEDLYMSERYRRSSASISTEVHETADRLEQRGDDVFPKFRNGFKVTSSVSGARIAGRPEIVAYHVDGSVTVDVSRSGEPEAADDVRDRLCMYLLPRSNQGRWRGSKMDGCVLYGDGTDRRIGADEIDDGFREMFADVMRQVVADESAPYVPSLRECGRCELTGDECGERLGERSSGTGGCPCTSC